MNLFRLFLSLIFVAVVGYTIVVVMNEGDAVSMQMLPQALSGICTDNTTAQVVVPHGLDAASGASERDPVLKPLWQHEQEIIERAIAACGGNVGAAAMHLDISPSTIYRKRHSWSHEGVA